MGRNDWYRITTWDQVIRDAFVTRLERSRTDFHKAQYLRIQAYTLFQNGRVESAVELLDLLFDRYPDKSQLASAHQLRAECFLASDRIDDAIDSYRAALRVESECKSVRTQVWLDLPWLVLTYNRDDLFQEMLEMLRDFADDHRPSLPIQVYKWAGASAILESSVGDRRQAARFARRAIEESSREHSGFRYHPDIGLVSNKQRQSELHRLLVELAEEHRPAQ